ncbi:hypothetical protein GCM10018785_34810 [Streptomyces longispororuber]|uniref:Uncharacterized protein n=1 Tax=Streptomyces longispororuber TaxID=68230 RepID=A0A918ZNY9_9ACTN|nr:hypothetical protein [Streptomyces longispororuber]GHE62902.1 hypothetical protein GCM10018785_34810 [Streptomyces longispororuber]
MGEPISKFDPAGKASILSYNVPEPTSYTGRNIIAFDLAGPLTDWFVGAAFKAPERNSSFAAVTPEQVAEALRTGDLKMFPGIKNPAATSAGLFATHTAVFQSSGALDTATTSVLAQGLRKGTVAPSLLPLVGLSRSSSEIHEGAAAGRAAEQDGEGLAETEVTHLPKAAAGSVLTEAALGDHRVRPRVTDIDVPLITSMLQAGKRLSVHRTLWGDYTHTFLPEPFPQSAADALPEGQPQIALVETYRLSTFLGQYGAGRTLKTFSLLPGEKTSISIKTWRKTETDSKSASSILDSFSKESADDFETTVTREQSDKQAEQKSLEWHVEAEASGSWGFASAKVSGGVKGSTASQREQFARNTSSAVNKHAAKASAKRDVQVNTSNEVKTESGEETAITRQLENINVGRTLNFVFRQINQEHITILHLVDVRVGFWNGYGESVVEVPLSGLDGLLATYVQPAKRAEVRKMVIEQLSTLFDYKDNLVQPPMVEERQLGPNDTYLRWRKTTSTYSDETNNAITVPGVIINVDKVVMRTDGVIVDALLGQGNALDDYSAALQANAVRRRTLANDREALGQDLVKASDSIKARIYRDLFPLSVGLPGKISVSASDAGTTVSTTQTAADEGDAQ